MTTFATDARRQIAAEKRRAAKLASLTIVAKATFKATGAHLYAVQSGEKTYHVTRIAGRVRSCVDAETGESCKTRQYGAGHCCHGDAVEQMEAAREQAALAEAQAHEELAIAKQVAAEVMPELVEDLPAHVGDELSSQRAQIARIADTDPTFRRVYDALLFGTVNHLECIMHRAEIGEPELVTNTLEILRSWDWIVIRKIERGKFWIDTPAMAYRTAYADDFAA